MKTAIINSNDLGLNCWLSIRFTGGECIRLKRNICKYPEKKTCKAYYIKTHIIKTIVKTTETIHSKDT